MRQRQSLQSSEEFGLVDTAQAKEVARIFLRHPDIHRVEVFGSVARDGSGNDLDIILITDEDLALDFLEIAEAKIKRWAQTTAQESVYNNPHLRQEVAVQVLGDDFVDVLAATGRIVDIAHLDVFVFSTDWRDYLETLQEALPHHDPQFMRHVAHDARVLAP